MEDFGVLGDLHVQLVKAEGLRDTALFGVQDPYVLVRYGHAVLKSRTDKDGGTNPVWNERLSFEVTADNKASVLHIVVKNSNLLKDNLIGEGQVSLEDVFETGHFQLDAPLLTKDDRKRGTVRLVLEYNAKNSAADVGTGRLLPSGGPVVQLGAAASELPTLESSPSLSMQDENGMRESHSVGLVKTSIRSVPIPAMSDAQHPQRAIQHPFTHPPHPDQSSFCQSTVYPEISAGAPEDQMKVGLLVDGSQTSIETVSPRSSGWSQFSSLTGSGDSGQYSPSKSSTKFPTINYGPTGVHSINSTGSGGLQSESGSMRASDRIYPPVIL